MTGSVAAQKLTGGCQCGAVRYEMVAAPEWVGVCHCRMCQKASGQPFMAFAGGRADIFRWTHGAPATFASSDLATRGFCARCGTPLSYARNGSSMFSVTLMSLDDPAALQPTQQNGMESKAAWVDALATLPGDKADDWLRSIGVSQIRNHQYPDTNSTKASA